MKLDGNYSMVIGIKDSSKLIGVSIILCCAVLVCTMFLNFYFDIKSIEEKIASDVAMNFYKAQVSTAKVVCLVSGGCLFVTSVVMLTFYVKHYIDTHKKELGILKALGYSNLKVAKNFWVFGISALIGTMIGFGGAFLLMPRFYNLQNKNEILPQISIHFHLIIFIYFVILPVIVFSLLAVGYAWYKLKEPVLLLLKNNLNSLNFDSSCKGKKQSESKIKESSFIEDLKSNVLRNKKILVFFIIFASFCFSAMTQMSFSMKDLSSEMMGIMMLMIGLILAFTTLFLAITTVINGNKKTIAMMRVFGYSQKECSKAILGGYRPMSYIGFAIGTVYQYVLLKIMVDIVFTNVEGVPDYKFDFPLMFISLVTFVITYEIIMFTYSEKIKTISIKEIMIE